MKTTKNNEKWSFIQDHPYRILTIGGSRSGKKNALLNLISHQDDIDKIYLYAKDLSEPKYKFLIKKHKNAGIKYVNDQNAFIECLNTMDDVYGNIDDYNTNRQRKILIVFDDMIADIISNKTFQAIIKELFIRCRILNISLVIITQSYFFCSNVRLNSTHLIMKIHNRKELQNIAINILADIDYNNFMMIYRVCTRKLYSFLTMDTTLPASDPLRFRLSLLPSYKNDS